MLPYAWALADRWLARGATTATLAPGSPGSVTSGLDALRGAWLQAFYLFTGAGASSLAGLTAASSFAWRVMDFLAILVAILIAAGVVRTVLGRAAERTPPAPAFCWRGRSVRSWRSVWA